MTEDKLSGLFDEIRKESAQTSISEVDQWIDAAAAAAVTAGIFATLKLVFIKKPLIMWTTLVTLTGGVSLSAVVLLSKPETKEAPVKKQEVASYSVPGKKPEIYLEKSTDQPEETETPKLEQPANEQAPEKNDQPEDMGTLVPFKVIKLDHQQGIPLYRKPDVTGNFTKIHLAGALLVQLTQGKECSVTIEPETAKDMVKVEIQNGTLYLKNEKDWNKRQEKLIVKVTISELDELFLSGATSLMTMHQFGSENLKLEMDGASNANLNLKTSKLKADFSGASKVVLEGSCEQADLQVSGAAEVNMSDISVKNAKINNSGAGHAELYISETLKVDGSGASTTYYKIAAGSKSVKVDANTSGAATIKDKK